MQILVRYSQAKFQSTADVIIMLAIRSDTSSDVYYFSPLFLVKLIFLITKTKQFVLLLICHNIRKRFLQNHYTFKLR